ncbi:MAG: hypothetical protein K9G63_09140 [Melioribacteraceae bacterium]|nr:hypothetical protein [Melioribacteraceae bacterium]
MSDNGYLLFSYWVIELLGYWVIELQSYKVFEEWEMDNWLSPTLKLPPSLKFIKRNNW